MEHYLGQKLKQLRQSRGWSQEDLAKKLNRGASTISGYETDAHAIPSNVLISIAEIFGVSLNELVNLNEPDAVSLKDLTTSQAETLIALRNEFLAPTNHSNDLSAQQMKILHEEGCTVISTSELSEYIDPKFADMMNPV